MEIEDEDSNSNSNIYENNLMAAPSSHSHSQHIPHRPSLLSQFAQPVSCHLILFTCSAVCTTGACVESCVRALRHLLDLMVKLTLIIME